MYWHKWGIIDAEDGYRRLSWNNYSYAMPYFSDSLEESNESIKLDPTFANPWNNKGFVFRYLGNYQEAIKCYNKAIELAPNSAIPWSNKGDALYQLRDTKEALACLNRSLELDQNNAVALSNKGVILIDMGRYDEALSSFDQAISNDPTYSYVPAWNGKGVVFAKTGRLNEALDCFRNAAMINNNYTIAWVNGGLALKALGEKNKSELAFLAARKEGYNKTIIDYVVQTEPQLMKDSPGSAKKSPDFGGALTMALLLAVGSFMIRRRMR